MKLSLVLCSIIGLFVAACASSEEVDPNKLRDSLRNCMPGVNIPCVCGLDQGSYTCSDDGHATQCICPQPSQGKTKPRPTPTSTTNPPDPPHPVCGDGQLDSGEACDDGNTTNNDGCSSTCIPDGNPQEADACPGQALTLWKGVSLLVAGSTDGYSDDTKASCYDYSGPDRIYAIHPHADGFVTVDATFAPGFEAIVEIRDNDCASSATQVLCEDTVDGTAFQRVMQVKADHTYYVVVDSDRAESHGAFTLRMELD